MNNTNENATTCFFLLNATSKRVVCSRLTVMGNKSLDQIINLVKYCHMTGENTGVEIASADKTLLTAIFPISDGPGAVNIWRGCKVGLVKAILRGAESLLGKIQWFMLGLREAEKPPAKSYELF